METPLNWLYVISMIFIFYKCELKKALVIFAVISIGLIVVRLGKVLAYLMSITGNLISIRKYYDPRLTDDERYISGIIEDVSKSEGDSNAERR